MRVAIIGLLAVGGLALDGCKSTAEKPKPPAKPARPAVIDMHTHIGPDELTRLHSILDEVGIEWVLNLSGGWPGGLLERQLEAAARSGRMLVACNLPWFGVRMKPKTFPQLAARLVTESGRLGARALKIEKALGLGVPGPNGKLLAVDDPWLDPIWRAAGEAGLPVVIHTGDPKAFWLPVDEKNERLEELTAHPGWSNYGLPIPTFDQLLAQMIAVVKRHPKTTFVAVHFGNNAEDPFWVGRMLDAHPNLYVDLAARVPELGRHDAKKLREVFIKHQDRIVFGSDLGVSPGDGLMLGSFGTEPNQRGEVGPYFNAQYKWLETDAVQPSPTPIQGRWNINGLALPPNVVQKIYRENALKLFGPAPQRTVATSSVGESPGSPGVNH